MLFSADESGALTGYTHGCEFDALPNGIAFGRSINSAGKDVFAIRKPTLGKANGMPLLGPVLFTEVHYNPAIRLMNPEAQRARRGAEFVEIWNRTDHPLPLFDPERPENTWRLKGTKFSIPEGQTLAPGETAIIVGTEPETFRERHGLPESLKIFGPIEGGLNNGGERITLLRPLAPEVDGDETTIPMVPVDSLRYNDRAPWPKEADGLGKSLERIEANGVTDEPKTWRASAKDGGTPGWTPFTLPTTTTTNENDEL